MNKKITAPVAFCLLLTSFITAEALAEANLSSSADIPPKSEVPVNKKKEQADDRLVSAQTETDYSATTDGDSEVSTQLTLAKTEEDIKPAVAKVKPRPSAASIAVEVNKDAITNNDVQRRLALNLISSGEIDKKATDELVQQIKEALIQEKLQRQIAEFLKVSVSKEELDQAITGIAKENNMTREQLGAFFASKGVDINTLRDRIESNLLWIKSVRDGIGAHIQIPDREVEKEELRLKQNEEKEQFEIAEIVLFVDTPESRMHTQREATNLHRQLTEGTPFSSVARNFSQSPSSAQGGMVGWVAKDQLPDDVTKLTVGRFSEPLLRGNRYIIYFIKDHKLPGQTAASESKMSYMDVKITLQSELSIDDQTRIGGFLEKVPTLQGCKALKDSAKASNFEVEELTDISTAIVPDGIRKLFSTSGKGKATEPVRLSETELRVFMLCGQKAPAKHTPPTRDEIRMALKEKRVQEQAVAQFNKLKAQATIVYRTPR